MTQEPTALPTTSYDWIGGDFPGLSGFAGTLYDHAGQLGNVGAALQGQVSTLISLRDSTLDG